MIPEEKINKMFSTFNAWIVWGGWDTSKIRPGKKRYKKGVKLTPADIKSRMQDQPTKRKTKMKKQILTTALMLATLTSCATQRFGREQQVSGTERKELTCKQINIELAKNEEFINNVRQQRASTSGAHVLGFLGDFGIGNVMEGDAAEASGYTRQKQLKDLQAEKC